MAPRSRFLRMGLLGLGVAAAAISSGGARQVTTAEPSPTEFSLFYEPTPPHVGVRMVEEGAVALAMVVALPERQVLGNTRKETFFARLIAVALQYVKVVVLVNRDEPEAAPRIRRLVSEQTDGSATVLDRLEFVDAVIDSEWIRDYGPLFGQADDGQLVLLDNMYRDVQAEAQTERTMTALGFVRTDDVDTPPRAEYLSDYGTFWRRGDDAAPLFVNEAIYRNQRRFAPIVRPPLQLAGGDVAFADGRMFTSTRTLQINGGDDRRLRRLARMYFGATAVTYLRPLPRGIWHVDMFLRLVRPGVVMLGTLDDRQPPGALRSVHRDAALALAWNRRLIRDAMPGVDIIDVPMPPLTDAGSERLSRTGSTGIVDLDAALTSSGARVKSLAPVSYRSFLNSVYINGGERPSAVLVPRYSGLEAMEPAVADAYRRAYPGAAVHFIDADVIAEEFGGIHCVTLTIPVTRR